jgi:large conductance mechanosensitive channel
MTKEYQYRKELSSMIKEFKEFISRGNVVDLAVGVIIGAAFGKIVTSVVSDIIMPPIGLLVGGVNFTGLKVTLKGIPGATEAVTINYGNFLQTSVDFLIIAFVIFLLVKGINKFYKKTDPVPTPTEKLLTEIRDILAKK